MSDTKFTPGPYLYYPGDRSLVSSVTGEHVAIVQPWNFVGHQDIQKANGSLLEAAPRLYHALAKVWENFDLDEFEDHNGNNFAWLADEVQAALAQARGETDAT